MFNIVSLLVVAALLSYQGFEVSANVMKRNVFNLDNTIHSVPSKRRVRSFVHISAPPPAVSTLEAGQRLELVCEAMGSPIPSIRWLRNGELLSEFDEELNEIGDASLVSLARLTSILPVTAAAGGDVYTCVALAGEHQDSCATTIYVEDPEASSLLALETLLIPSPPRITSYYSEVLQEMGTEVTLRCRASDNVQPRWWRNNAPVFMDNRIKLLPSGDLILQELRWSDMGDYVCTVKNANGKDSITTFLYPTKG